MLTSIFFITNATLCLSAFLSCSLTIAVSLSFSEYLSSIQGSRLKNAVKG